MKLSNPPELWNYLSEVLSKLSQIEGRVCLVGGSVRDFLKDGKVGADIDLVVEEQGGAEHLAQALRTHWNESSSDAHALGAGYPIWQLVVKIPANLSLGFDKIEIQIADTQKEMFPDPTTRQRITRFGNLNEDCARRDFTVNMLYYDLRSQEVLDPSNAGLHDLQARRLASHPKVDAQKIFADDPLRMLRLLRFRSSHSFEVDAGLWLAFDATFSRVGILSAERVRDEILKVIGSGGLADFMDEIRARGRLAEIFPEFAPMPGCGQDKTYHSEGDVWVHTLMVMRNAPRTPELQLAALLHDVGKPATREEKGERVSFILHERHSTGIAKDWLTKWRFGRDLRERVLTLVALHLRGGDVNTWKSMKPARKLIRDAGAALPELLDLIEADSRSSLGPDGKARTQHLPLLRARLDEASRLSQPARPALSGHVIMDYFSLGPGPRLREIKDLAEEVREDMIVAGENPTEEQILQKVAVLMKNPKEVP